jgi:para-aminobenzoate N-oxygenase AurF
MTTRWLDPVHIERLAASPARRMQMPSLAQVSLDKPFVPEEHTQLFYTPVYRSLHREHRLRYNQLFGVRINEYIMMLEADLVERLLAPLRRHPNVAGDAPLVRCIDTMIEEEKQHFACFAEFNSACFPALYRNQDRYFSDLPWAMRALFGLVGLVAGRLPFALWYLMAMEESSTALARDLTRNLVTETLGEIEPSFAAVHREHLKDETRHLQIDGILIDRCVACSPRAARLLNASLFKSMLRAVTRPTRSGSGIKVIRELVRQMPELSWREDEMIRQVLALKDDAAFQTSLFNRRAMPLTFGVFDDTAELDNLGNRMIGYDRR